MRWGVWAVGAALVACGGDTIFVVDGGPADALAACTSDAACDDGLFCNGVERCAPGTAGADLAGCVFGASPCLAGERCDEGGDACLASCALTPDADGDGVDALACGGLDCDDTRADVFPGNIEICDDANLDEDCDVTTVGMEDRDGDGFVSARCCNAGPEGLRCGPDCGDQRRDVRPGFIEVCDEVDNDCDGMLDEGVSVEAFVDADGDLHGAEGSAPVPVCPGRRGFACVADDCDDAEITVHGAQLEITDGLDNDCDGAVDEGATALRWYADLDDDAFGDPDATPVLSSEPLLEFSLRPSDCDDGDRGVNPAATELCDARDTDCDGRADFFIIPGLDTEDDDEDGFADATCGGADCDDGNAAVGPGQVELADGVDNDCDGTVDESPGARDWWPDLDRDGWGDAAATPRSSMTPLPASAPRAGDCDDGDATIRPGVRDACDGRDRDCDDDVDEDAPLEAWYLDGDGDGAGRTDDAQLSCRALAGRVTLPGDCDDTSPEVAPGAAERCNDRDDDCDGGVDEAVPDVWYPDGDGDGVGVAEGAVMTCDPGPGFAPAEGDCADDDPFRFPGADERCNGIDDDCDGTRDGSAADARCAGAAGVLTGSCVVPACTIDACIAGFADCDGLPETGCEVPTDRDPRNCGGCGLSCAAADGCGTSVGGRCAGSPLVDVAAADLPSAPGAPISRSF
ncbi:MAG: putative metal-binding motif-containing protein [Myxococcota bacterium]